MNKKLKKLQLIIAGILAIIMLTASMPYSSEASYYGSYVSDNTNILDLQNDNVKDFELIDYTNYDVLSSLNWDHADELLSSLLFKNDIESYGIKSTSSTSEKFNHTFEILDKDGKTTYCTITYNVTKASTLFSDVEVYEALNDFPDYYKTYLDMLYGQIYPNATKLGTATVKYNCHYYAWFNGDDSYWYDSSKPQIDFSDGSCVEVTSPSAGDIICYFDANGNNIHSGVVASVSNGTSNGICGNADLVTVKSKWGTAGLYQHRGDQCPYTSTYGGNAVSVKYYHRHVKGTMYTQWCIFS